MLTGSERNKQGSVIVKQVGDKNKVAEIRQTISLQQVGVSRNMEGTPSRVFAAVIALFTERRRSHGTSHSSVISQDANFQIELCKVHNTNEQNRPPSIAVKPRLRQPAVDIY